MTRQTETILIIGGIGLVVVYFLMKSGAASTPTVTLPVAKPATPATPSLIQSGGTLLSAANSIINDF